MTTEEDVRHEAAERKRMDSIWWAGVLIWIGLALAGEYFEILPEIGDSGEWWPWIFVGVGAWSILLNLYRTTSSWPNPSTWDWIWTAIFSLVALGSFVDFEGEIVGAVVLVVIGVVFLVKALSRGESTGPPPGAASA
jgi:hypothetical protein